MSKRFLLPQGRFCIVPSTFARNDEGDYLLRIYAEKSWGSSEGAVRETVERVYGGINGAGAAEADSKPK